MISEILFAETFVFQPFPNLPLMSCVLIAKTKKPKMIKSFIFVMLFLFPKAE